MQRAIAAARDSGTHIMRALEFSLFKRRATFPKAAPVVFARDVSAAHLAGAIGHDSDGRVSIQPGQLMRANGGFLVVEAWRLAAAPEGWAVCRRHLNRRHQTMAAPGMIVDAEPVKLYVRVILLADPESLEKLAAIDPGFAEHFPQSWI